MNTELTPIQNLIYEIRGYRVMLDSDLAKLYGIETKILNKAVKRNIQRFPKDFMFQLTKEEYQNLRFQNGTSNKKHGGRRYMPYVFTEQGVAMLSSVLQSEKAIAINIQIMRTFVQFKRFTLETKDISKRLQDVEKYLINYCKENEADKQEIYKALDLLIESGFSVGRCDSKARNVEQNHAFATSRIIQDRTKPSKVGFIK